MANKASMAIELKEMGSYPTLEPVKEEENKSPQKVISHLPAPIVNPSNSRNTPLTPIVPISTNPPPLSFVEQQRLSAQLPRPANQNSPPVPINSPAGVVENNFLTVACSGCRGLIRYPPHVPIVYCLQCRANTATKPLINIVCSVCQNSAYYAADNTHVRCRCGMVYAIRLAN